MLSDGKLQEMCLKIHPANWTGLFYGQFEINEVVLECFKDLIGMNILPGASRQQLAVILDLRQNIRLHDSFMKPKDKDLAVCINPNDKVLSKMLFLNC